MARTKGSESLIDDGRVAFLLKMPPELRDALRLRKALTGADMTDIIIETLEGELSDELDQVRSRRG